MMPETTVQIQTDPLCRNEEVLHLIRQSRFGWSSRQREAWMDFRWDPDHAIALYRSGQLAGLLQYHPLRFSMNGKQCIFRQAEPLFLLPQDLRENQDLLLEAFSASSSCNVLLAGSYTMAAGSWTKKGFVPVLHFQEYAIQKAGFSEGSERNVFRWEGREDLYPIYLKFLSVFTACCIYSRDEFDRLLKYARYSGCRISVTRSSGRSLRGFCLWKSEGTAAEILWMIYLDSEAFCSLLKDLLMTHTSVRLRLSENEKAADFLKDSPSFAGGDWMVKCFQPSLFSDWQNQTVKNTAEIFSSADVLPWMDLPV